MINLSNDILDYYLAHFEELSFDKQFHFASRLHLWNNDTAVSHRLDGLRAEFTYNDRPHIALQAVITKARQSASHGTKNAASLRQPYFERYPNLKTYLSALFRMHFMETVYGIDSRQDLRKLIDSADLLQLRQDLLADDEAVAILSTHAINFLYLHDRSLQQDETSLPIEYFLAVGRSQYDLTDKIQLQLFIYLYTHCIIGESRFYYRHLPPANLHVYNTMLAELETIISDNFEDINLDNKCEFLVCAKLLGQSSQLESRIFKEASGSLSVEGHYLVDRHNNHPQLDNVDLEKSEHRNVLYIMASRDFRSSVQ